MEVPTVGILILVWTFLLVNPEYTCFSSSSSKAKSIQSVYDGSNDYGSFWDKNNSPLAPCNLSSIYSSSKCSVCLVDSVGPEAVLVAFCNLTSSVQLVFEGPGGHLNFNRTGCPPPQPSRAAATTPGPAPIAGPNNKRGSTGVYIGVGCFILALLILLFLLIVPACKHSQPQQI